MGGCPRRGQVRFNPASTGPSVTSVAVTDDSAIVRFSFDAEITSVDDFNAAAFVINGNPGDTQEDFGFDWIEVAFGTDIAPGQPWSITPPTGLEFDGGGDVAASSGTVS